MTSVTVWMRRFFTIYFWEHAWIHWGHSYSLSIWVVCPCPLRDHQGDMILILLLPSQMVLIAAQVLVVFTIHISKPTVFHQQNLDITSAYSVFGLCLVHFSITVITLFWLLFFFFCLIVLVLQKCNLLIQPVTVLWLSLHICKYYNDACE